MTKPTSTEPRPKPKPSGRIVPVPLESYGQSFVIGGQGPRPSSVGAASCAFAQDASIIPKV